MRFVVAAAALSLVACAAHENGRDQADERTGSASQAIINGVVSTPDQNFVVELASPIDGQMFPACSAIMVAKNLVLTARHCVGTFKDDTSWEIVDQPASVVEVYFGANAPQRINANEKSDARGAKLFVPPTNLMIPDVALLLLDKPIAAAPIARIRLDGGAQKNEMLDIVGFGLNEASVEPTVRMQRKGVPVIDLGPLTTTEHELFDGEFVFGEAACSGDSGGPALSATTRAVIGVASRVGNGLQPTETNPAAFCVGPTTQDVYTSLAPVKDVVLRAFKEAGATPFLENDPEPPPAAEAPAQSTPRPQAEEEEEDDTDARPAARKSSVPTAAANGGCSVSSETETTRRPTSSSLLALLACAFVVSRRARSSRAR